MEHREKLDKIRQISPESKFRLFLIDLLKKIGFSNVQHTHRYGAPEYGKDIIASFKHELESHEWYAFVVKIGKIRGGTNDIETIKNQINQCFEYSYEDVNGNEIRVNKVKVVSNNTITRGAQEAIKNSAIVTRNANIEFWNDEKIIEYVDRKYSNYWVPQSPFIVDYCAKTRASLTRDFELKVLNNLSFDDKKAQRLIEIFVKPTLFENKIVDNDKGESALRPVKVHLFEIESSEDNFIITGEPGTGKTRIIEQIANNFTIPENVVEKKVLPIRVPIHSLKELNYDIEQFTQEHFQKMMPGFENRIELEEYTKLYLIDSIDFTTEEERSRILEALDQYAESDKCRFIIAARVADGFNFDQQKAEVRNIKVYNFNVSQVKEFISRYFDGSVQGEKFITILQESNLLSKIPTTPLTLTLLALLYEDNGYEIPATQTDIYRDFVQVLLGKLEVRSKHQLLDLSLKNRMISVIALEMLKENVQSFQLDDFVDRINTFLRAKGYEEQSEHQVITLIMNTGFLFLDQQLNVGFKHAAFLEYFASGEIYDHKRKQHYDDLIMRFNEPHWQNTAVFFAGRSKDMPDFISDLLSEMPNESARDLGINIGGLGYLGQSLYMTDLPDRQMLVRRALDNIINLYNYMKEWTGNPESPYYNLSIQVIVMSMSYWFSFNFRSITLTNVLKTEYDRLVKEEDVSDTNNFSLGLKLFVLASTLTHKYIDDWEKFEHLLDLPCFINNPALMIAGDLYLEFGETTGQKDNSEYKKKFKRKIKQYRDILVHLTKEPAYRFDDELKMIE